MPREPLTSNTSPVRINPATNPAAAILSGATSMSVVFASREHVWSAAEEVLRRAGGRSGHIFNFGHGILPETPEQNVKMLVEFVHERAAKFSQAGAKTV